MSRSTITLALCDLLRSANGTVSYEAISGAAGRPMAEIRATLAKARLYLERDEGVVFATVRGQGLRRLTDAEKVESTAGFVRRIHRTAGSGAARLDAVADFAALPPQDQLSATIRRTMFEAVRRETHTEGVR